MRAILALLLTASAGAQGLSSLVDWRFGQTLRDATDILVGDIVAGSAIDQGDHVDVKARVRVVRVLHGAAAPGSELTLAWRFRPSPKGPASFTAQLPPVRALWFLRKDGAGAIETLRAAYTMPVAGGHYLPAATAARPYAAEATLKSKVASELGAAMEEMAERYAADLTQREGPLSTGGASPEWAQTRTRFLALAMGLDALDPSATTEVYARLSLSSDPLLKAVGIQGRYNAGDSAAMLDLERNLIALAPIFNGAGGALGLRGREGIEPNLAAMHAFGRIALAETTIAGIEWTAGTRLGWTRKPEFLPYLVTMLGSPNPGVRGSALMGLCALLRGGSLWLNEMSGYCPQTSLIDAEEERRQSRFWLQWWNEHREAIARTVPLPVVARPARYDASPAFMTKTEVPLATRFMNLATMNAVSERRSGPRPPDRAAAELSAGDLAIWREAMATAAAKIEAFSKKMFSLQHAARMTGTKLDEATSRALEAEWQDIGKSGVEDLRRRLTSGGWETVERLMLPESAVTPAK